MKISKYIHSCLLVRDQSKVILIDPGIYSYNEKALGINSLSRLDAITITHEHPDHMHIPFIKALIKKFPNVQILTNDSIVKILEKEGISATTKDNEFIKLKEVPHEKIFFGPSPENVMVTVFGKLSHPGDSLTFQTKSEILALPLIAPWGSTTWAVEKAIKIKPKIIIPIHDYQWKDEVRKWMYEKLEEYFGKNGIIFKKLETGEIIET